MWKKFSPCSPCCRKGMPLILISTFDSSINYSHLCLFENSSGTGPGLSCSSSQPHDPDGSCVQAPKQVDKTKWNLDVANFTNTRLEYESEWPVAAGIVSGGFRCWGGVKKSICAITEPWIEDSYGEADFMVGGLNPTIRITLSNLKTLFETLYNKHGFTDAGGNPSKLGKCGLLLLVDNTGSIDIHKWQYGTYTLTLFNTWIITEYPNCEKTIIFKENYILDGEDWVRHFDEFYRERVEQEV